MIISPLNSITAAALLTLALGCNKTSDKATMSDTNKTDKTNDKTVGKKAPSIVGLWAARIELGHNKAMALELERKGSKWIARVDGQEAALDAKTGRAIFGDEQLRLRQVNKGSPTIRGHWVQRPSPMLSYPTATPVSVEQSGSVWRGEIAPLADLMHLYVAVVKQPDGTLTAFVREPGVNAGRAFRDLTVVAQGDKYSFRRAGENGADGGEALVGQLDSSTDTLTLTIERLGRTVAFARRDETNAVHFYPRLAGAAKGLATPHPTPDGWEVESPKSANIDEAALAAIVAEIAGAAPTSWASPAIHALVVARDGKLVLEEYFAGTSAEEPHDTRSAGKSFASTIVGVAVDRGKLTVDTPLFKAMKATGKLESRKKAITVESLLTMSSGLECDDNDYDNSKGNEDRMQEQDAEPDWHAYAWSLPMVRDPGAKGVYCSAGINLVGAALVDATGRWIPDIFATTLAGPLGIERYHFNLMPTLEGYLGGGIRLKPRDFAKLGQLFLAKGLWNGKRVLSEAWVTKATRAHSGVNEPNDYGYAWWLMKYTIGDQTLDAYYASGNGGQLIIVVPDRQLVIAFMAGNYGNYGTWRTFRDDIAKRIVAAAR